MTGLSPRSLQMIIHGFVLKEGTKPVHEHHLQVSLRAQALILPFTGTLKCYNT